MNPEMTLKYYGGTAWNELRSASWKGKIFHGIDLVMKMNSGDNVEMARRCLAAAEELGILERKSYCPRSEQCFFGLNAKFGKDVQDPTKTNQHETAYEWEWVKGPVDNNDYENQKA